MPERGDTLLLPTDYQLLGLGEATSVVTAITVDQDDHTIVISGVHDPRGAQTPDKLGFKKCERIAWQTFDEARGLQHLDTELIGISLGSGGAQRHGVLTTDAFELSFVYGSYSLHTPTSPTYSARA